jgi:hypothetical protein
MKARAETEVHPRYKGTDDWEVKAIAELSRPIKYNDPELGRVSYRPSIVLLESADNKFRALWFAYRIGTSRSGGQILWGQGPAMYEEDALLELFKDAIGKNLFTISFLSKLTDELEVGISKWRWSNQRIWISSKRKKVSPVVRGSSTARRNK